MTTGLAIVSFFVVIFSLVINYFGYYLMLKYGWGLDVVSWPWIIGTWFMQVFIAVTLELIKAFVSRLKDQI